jgi:ATP-dependent DNA helicase RecQ
MVGGNTERIRSMRHDQLSTFGLLRELTKSQVTDLIGQLVATGCLGRIGGDRPVLTLVADGVTVLRGDREIELAKPARGKVPRDQRAPKGRDATDWSGIDRPLFEGLRELRRGMAAARKVPAYVVANDAVLRDLARFRPSTLEAMSSIRGIGRKKLVEQGPELLAFLDAWCPENGLARDMVD